MLFIVSAVSQAVSSPSKEKKKKKRKEKAIKGRTIF